MIPEKLVPFHTLKAGDRFRFEKHHYTVLTEKKWAISDAKVPTMILPHVRVFVGEE